MNFINYIIKIAKIVAKKQNKDKIKRYIIISFFVIAAFLLVWLLTTTLNNTLVGDDMIFFKDFQNKSIISVAISSYLEWTARISSCLVIGAIFKLSPQNFLPYIGLLISITGLVGSLYFLGMQMAMTISKPTLKLKLGVLLLSIISTLSICLYENTIYENLYWIAGVACYVVPVIVFGFLTGIVLLIVRKSKNPNNEAVCIFSIVVGLMSLFASLLNEAFTLQLLSLSIFSLIGVYIIRPKPLKLLKPLLISILIGVLIGVVIISLSPGTGTRTEVNRLLNPGFDHSIPSLVISSFPTAIKQIAIFLRQNTIGIIAVYFTGIGVIHSLKIFCKTKLNVLISVVIATLLGPGMFLVMSFAIRYAYQSEPTAYTVFTSNYFAYISIIFLSFASSYFTSKIKKHYIIASIKLIATLMIITFLMSSAKSISHINRAMVLQKAEFARTESIINKAVGAGKDSVDIGNSVKYFTYCAPVVEKTTWCNQSYARYYGIKDISASIYVEVDYKNNIFQAYK